MVFKQLHNVQLLSSEHGILLPGLYTAPFMSSVLKFIDGDSMMYSSYKRQRILHFDKQGHKLFTICCLM